MRIGIDASRANQLQRTGTEWYSFHVIEELKRIIPVEHEVVLYSKEPLRDDLARLPANWTSRVLRWPPGLLWTQLRLSWEMLWQAPDILYIPAHTIPLIHTRRIVLVVHDVGFARTNELYNPKQIGYSSSWSKRIVNAGVRLLTLGKYGASERDYHRFAMELARKHASVILTVSNFSRQEILELYPDIPADRVVVAENSFHPRPESTESAADVLQRLGITQPFVLYLGRIEEKKNIPRLVRAWSSIRQQLPGHQLVLAGSAGYGADAIQEDIIAGGLTEAIIRTGWVEDAVATVLLSQAEAFILPSLYEGFGIPVLEAMVADTPVICSDIPPLREVASEAAVYFDPSSEGALVDAVMSVVADPVKQAQLRRAGHERIKHFSWANTAQRTWEALSHVQ